VLEQTLRIPADLPCLEGHFAQLAVLPGLAQLSWAVRATARMRGHDLHVTGIEALKFRELLRPGESFVARLEAPDDRDRTSFEIRRGDAVAASGRLRLAPEPVPVGGLVNAPPTSVDRDAREFLPQSGPMVFVDRVLAAEADRTWCSLQVDKLQLFVGADAALPAWAGIEPMAQCIAAHGGLEARRRGQAPRVGFLLGCRRLQIGTDRLEPGVPYAVVAEQVWGGEEGLVSFDCDLFEREGGRRLLAGRLNAYLPANLGELTEGRIGG
jgi:predicted hotdog family 3-hydroxylacyl-ACP dehydratase